MNDNELDYRLYQLLEENDFETTESNLEMLKTGLSEGLYDILDVSNVEINENMTSDEILSELLKANDYDTDEENIKELAEGLQSNEILLTEGIFRKWKNKIRARKRMKQMWKDGKAGPQQKHASSENTTEKNEGTKNESGTN